jgi:hypothetical protein
MTVAHTGQTGRPPVPLVWLRSYKGAQAQALSDAEVTRVRSSGCDAVVRVDGPGWTGSVYAPQARAAVPVRYHEGAREPAILVKERP